MRKYYGYKIVDGEMCINRNEAEKIQLLYEKYIEGLSIAKAGLAAGIKLPHPSLGRILSNPVYCGNEIYSVVVSKEIFD